MSGWISIHITWLVELILILWVRRNLGGRYGNSLMYRKPFEVRVSTLTSFNSSDLAVVVVLLLYHNFRIVRHQIFHGSHVLSLTRMLMIFVRINRWPEDGIVRLVLRISDRVSEILRFVVTFPADSKTACSMAKAWLHRRVDQVSLGTNSHLMEFVCSLVRKVSGLSPSNYVGCIHLSTWLYLWVRAATALDDLRANPDDCRWVAQATWGVHDISRITCSIFHSIATPLRGRCRCSGRTHSWSDACRYHQLLLKLKGARRGRVCIGVAAWRLVILDLTCFVGLRDRVWNICGLVLVGHWADKVDSGNQRIESHRFEVKLI